MAGMVNAILTQTNNRTHSGIHFTSNGREMDQLDNEKCVSKELACEAGEPMQLLPANATSNDKK